MFCQHRVPWASARAVLLIGRAAQDGNGSLDHVELYPVVLALSSARRHWIIGTG